MAELDLTQIPAQCGIHATLAECERMGDMVANIVTAVAVSRYPDDPDKASAFALASIDRVYGLGPSIEAVCSETVAHREDVEETGCCDACGTFASQEPGYYPRELETADEAAADLEAQETS